MPLVDPVTMSTPSNKTNNAQTTKATEPSETSIQPVSILSAPIAQTIRHVHPVVLVAVFSLGFKALVADPVTTMGTSIPVIAVIQTAYSVSCLPPVGGTVAPKKLRPGEKKKPSTEATSSSKVVVSLLALYLCAIDLRLIPFIQTALIALALSAFASPLLYVVMVLFGAPFLTHLAHTFLCSLHLAMLSLPPLFYTRGVSGREWLAIAGARAPLDEAFGGLIGGCVGAWLGAVPIPLDWDREWQKWPVTILCGVYGGYVLGKVLGGSLGFGRRWTPDEKKEG